MADSVPSRAVIDVAQRKRVKYMAKCAAIGYGFLPFSFSSLGELEDDAVTLLKRIWKFFMTRDIGARTAVHIFNRIGFAIAKGLLLHFGGIYFNSVVASFVGQCGKAQAITKHSILSDLVVYERAELAFKRIGLWLCGFVLYDLTKPQVPSCSEQLDHVGDEVHDLHGGFTLALLDSLFSKGLRTVKSIPSTRRLGFSRVLKGALDKVICKPNDISCWEESIVNAIRSWGMPGSSLQLFRKTLAESSRNLSDVDDEDIDLGERNIKQCKRKISDGHYTMVARVLSSFGVAPYSDATLEDLKTKHPFKPAPTLLHIPYDHHHLVASPTVVLDKIKASLGARLVGEMGYVPNTS
ncbi:hypothetical protein Tco_0149690 [Tanacetum coccineum]